MGGCDCGRAGVGFVWKPVVGGRIVRFRDSGETRDVWSFTVRTRGKNALGERPCDVLCACKAQDAPRMGGTAVITSSTVLRCRELRVRSGRSLGRGRGFRLRVRGRVRRRGRA